MKTIRDTTGRFQQRPHYEPQELDLEFERIIKAFLKERHGEVRYPVDTEDLKVLIERDVEDLDVYANLSSYGQEVEGVTEFRRGQKPRVSISATLTENARQENRLRTTLTHEYGHVHLHRYLFETELPPDLLKSSPNAGKVVCKRDTMTNAAQTDWMEWQAGYACGAILMPKSALKALVAKFVEESGVFGIVSRQSGDGAVLIAQTMKAFQVSEDAARVRLVKLGYLGEAPPTKSLFG